MKIDLTNIPPEGKKIAFRLEQDWWRPDFDEDRILGLKTPIDVRIKVYPAGNRIVVEGYFSVTMSLRCDRCLKLYSWNSSKDFKLYLSMIPFKGEAEVGLTEDDINLDFIDNSFLDSDQIVKEQLILDIPLRNLCEAECKGLCPFCGCNLNTAKCPCSSGYSTSNYQR